ncbi:MAG: ATPase, T2SS/T4P/T4SS family, partial [Patescibacteria group bacterium]
MTVQFDEEKEEEKLARLRKKEEEDLAETLSSRYGVPYLDLSVHPIDIDSLRIIKEADARAAGLAVFNATDKNIDVAVLAPQNEKTIAVIEELKHRDYVPTIYMVSNQSLEHVWNRYKDMSYSFETKSGALDISNDQIIEMIKKVTTLEDIKKLVEDVLSMKRSYRISRILEIILAGGIALKASDIHLEPEDLQIRLRYRLDGVLTDILNFDKDTYELLLSRIKLVSELKL